MLSRIRIALGFALFVAQMASIQVFAKGGYSFITIAAPTLKDTIRSSDPALTTDFFAFSVFYEDKIEAPSNPGEGYEITRYYTQGNRDVPFDRLHYYPEAGFVYYDGIVNGSSEYDGEWYQADPEIKTPFESALGIAARSKPPMIQAVAFLRQTRMMLAIIFTAGLAILLLIAYRTRRIPTR